MRVNNGWTGGQYSAFRFLFGAYLFVHFIQLIPWGVEVFSNRGVLPKAAESPLILLFPNPLALWDSPAVVTLILAVASGLSLFLAVGKFDRFAAVALWYILACLFGRNPLIANPSLPYIGWMLLAHTFLPPAPYGSSAARGRADPGGSWKLPAPIYTVAWILLAIGYTYSGYEKIVSPSWINGSAFRYVLESPLARPTFLRHMLLAMPTGLLKAATWGGLGFELSFAPLAFVRRLRPWIWLLMLAMHLSLVVLLSFADLSFGMVLLHIFTFNPDWVPARRAGATETLFYDGHCGLCHRFVRFVLAEDPKGATFRFAPLNGELFRDTVVEEDRGSLPDSLVVQTTEGAILTRSVAVLHILRLLGGIWRLSAGLARVIPTGLSNQAYDFVARVRYRLFARARDVCPLIPATLRTRFVI